MMYDMLLITSLQNGTILWHAYVNLFGKYPDNRPYRILWKYDTHTRMKKLPIFMHHTVLSGFSFQFFFSHFFYWLFPIDFHSEMFSWTFYWKGKAYRSNRMVHLIYCWMCTFEVCVSLCIEIYLTNLRVLFNPSGKNSFWRVDWIYVVHVLDDYEKECYECWSDFMSVMIDYFVCINIVSGFTEKNLLALKEWKMGKL